jgi:hypothetical protein
VGSKTAADVFSAEILKGLAETVKELQREVSMQNAKYIKMSNEAAVTQAHYDSVQAFHEAQSETHRSQIIDLEDALMAEKAEKAALLERPAKYRKLDDPEYASRFEVLMQMGIYKMDEVERALEATQQDGKFSSQRADAYLKTIASARRAEALKRANAAISEDQPAVTETSALGRILSLPEHEDAVDIVVKLRDVHARGRAKNAHSATPAICASNLLDVASVKNDAAMGRKGITFLSRVANAVSEDCPKCFALRQAAEANNKGKEGKAKSKPDLAAPIPATKHEKKRLTLPFKPSNSRRDVSKPRGKCVTCNRGWAAGRYLYFCDECDKGVHLLCTDWKHLRLVSGGATWFACAECKSVRDQDIEQGDLSKLYVEVDDEVDHDLAPLHSEEAEKEVPDQIHEASATPVAKYQTDAVSGNARSAPVLPPALGFASPRGNLPGGRSADSALLLDQLQTPSLRLEKSELNSTTGKTDAKPNVTVKDYFTWEKTPDDWVPKPGAVGDKRHHPERGYNKLAYQNWRRKNVTIRDSVKAQGSSLGPLVRAISVEMKLTVGRQFIQEPALSCFWPKPVMKGKDIDEWVQDDPDFSWFLRIPDDTLLSLLDKRFGVKKPDLFLSKRFPSDLPATDANGDVNYHADYFNRWASDWQTELTELMKAGCDFADVDLKQTFLNAISGNKLLYNQAIRYNTTSYMALIAHLCDWVLLKEEGVTTERNEKASLIGLSGSHGNASNTNASNSGSKKEGGATGGGAVSGKATATALLTQIVSHLGRNSPAESQAVAKPLPTHLKPHPRNALKVICRGCNNAWSRDRNIPCFKGCKYDEHPAYNKDCREKDGKSYTPLTWKGFREAYPKVTPPANMILWEETEKKRTQEASKKRTRDDDST